ncbi:MAG: AMP-binding protein, partial [Acidimicrobiales bacterium]
MMSEGSPQFEIRCVADVLRVHAKERPDAPALECDDQSLTFGQLHERASRVAAALTAEGVGPQSRVAFVARNGLPAFEVTFGASLLNAVAVHVNWRLAGPEIAQIIDDSDAEVVVVGPEFVEVIEKIESELSKVKRFVSIGDHDRWTGYDEWVAAHQPDDPGTVGGPEDTAYQLYTSGTTGLPKGVMLTNTNLVALLDKVNDYWEFVPEESVNLALMPMFHIAGLGWAVVGLAYGCRTIVLADVDLPKILVAIGDGVTHAFMVPVVIQFLLLTEGIRETDFSSLRKLVYGASPISSSVLTEAMDVMRCQFVQVYGSTETTGAVTQLAPDEHDPASRPELLRSCG